MMNGILTALLIFSVVTAAFTGRIEALSAAPMEILPAVWLTGLSSLAVVLLLDRLLRGKSHRPE